MSTSSGPTQPADDLRARIAEALNTCHMPLASENEALRETYRHDGHIRDGACYVCRGDVPKLADAALSVVEPELARLSDENAAYREREAKTFQALRLDPETWAVQLAALSVRQERDRLREEVVAALAELNDRSLLSGSDTTRIACADGPSCPEHGDGGRAPLHFKIGDLVRWSGDLRWFGGRINGVTTPEHKLAGDEQWSVEVTDLGTLYAGQDALLGITVHVSETRLSPAGAAVPAPADTEEG